MESLDVPCYKIASFENTDLPLIRKVASTGKPMIISTGMATVAELDEMCANRKGGWMSGLSFTQVYKYLSRHSRKQQSFDDSTSGGTVWREVGLSDHNGSRGSCCQCCLCGATVIEKALFTLRRADGVDSAFSMEPKK